MFQIIKDLVQDFFKKWRYIHIVLILFCIFITIFKVPEGVLNHNLIKILFPKEFMDDNNKNLVIFGISFFGFLTIIFLVTGVIYERSYNFFRGSFYILRRISEKISNVIVFLFEYLYIFIILNKISVENIMLFWGEVEYPSLFLIGLFLPLLSLGEEIYSFVYTSD